jgi:hypothetical protein
MQTSVSSRAQDRTIARPLTHDVARGAASAVNTNVVDANANEGNLSRDQISIARPRAHVSADNPAAGAGGDANEATAGAGGDANEVPAGAGSASDSGAGTYKRTAGVDVRITSRLDAAILCTQAKAALTGLGWKPAIAQTAVAAAAAANGSGVTLEQLIIESLRRCPIPKA